MGRIGDFDIALPKKAHYLLGDFLAYHDEDFIRNVYRALLGREPDAEGASRYLAKIRSGDLSRIEVLGRIRFSAEGKAAGVPVVGVLVPFCMRTARRIPVIGRLLGIIQYAWRLPDLARNHEILESALFANRTEMRGKINATISEVEQALVQVRMTQSEQLSVVTSRIEATVANVDRTFGELHAGLLDARTSAQVLDGKILDTAERLRALITDAAKGTRDLDTLRDANSELAQRLAQLLPTADFMTLVASTERATGDIGRIARALDDVRTQLRSQGKALQQETDLDILLDAAHRDVKHTPGGATRDSTIEYAGDISEGFYAAFEDRFRGTRDDIKQRVAVYLPLVRAAGAGSSEAPIVDIGCGRGEWLELLHEQNLAASGIDLNRVAVAGCRGRGLDAIEADGIAHLRGLPPDSLGAVSAIHVIEHLPFARMIELFDEARRVLWPGGIVIFETPNPENLIVGACNFYYDPTHVRPLPPEPYRFMLESRGFDRVEIMRLHPDPEAPAFADSPRELAQVISERFFGSRDYALIGFKP
ncbi:MAG: methyltransferase domain-containing protein [Pseudomonadota bacterium]|nr:methyltransferase domain-containing protein [Pseudomonadota bacterium]